MTAYQRQHIASTDRARHAPLLEFVPKTFPSVDFVRWSARGGWTADYDAFVMLDRGEIVSGIGRTRMRFWIDGREVVGHQLGAVATLEAHRGRGLSRALMEWIIAESKDEPAILFANERVLDFYPRFGYRRVMQRRIGLRIDAQPTKLLPQWDMDDPEPRARLESLCARSVAHSPRLAARDYFSPLLWHLTYRAVRVHRSDALDALFVVSQSGACLTIHDVIATRSIALEELVSELIDAPITHVEFGFDPGPSWPGAQPLGTETHSPMFVRNVPSLVDHEVRFPDFAAT